MSNVKIKLKRPINVYLKDSTNLYVNAIKTFTGIKNKVVEYAMYKKSFKKNEIYKGLFDKRSWIDPEGVWHVFPMATSKHSVLIICPLCGQIHSHGAGDDGLSYEGHRVAHCSRLISDNMYNDVINDGYIIEDLKLLDKDEYNLWTEKNSALANSFQDYK